MGITFKIYLLLYSCIKCPDNNPLFPGADEFLQDLGKCFHEDKDFVLVTDLNGFLVTQVEQRPLLLTYSLFSAWAYQYPRPQHMTVFKPTGVGKSDMCPFQEKNTYFFIRPVLFTFLWQSWRETLLRWWNFKINNVSSHTRVATSLPTLQLP